MANGGMGKRTAVKIIASFPRSFPRSAVSLSRTVQHDQWEPQREPRIGDSICQANGRSQDSHRSFPPPLTILPFWAVAGVGMPLVRCVWADMGAGGRDSKFLVYGRQREDGKLVRRCRIRWTQRRVSFWSPAIRGRAEGLRVDVSVALSGRCLPYGFLAGQTKKRSIESANLELRTLNFGVEPTKRQPMRRNSSSELCEGQRRAAG